MKGYEVVLAPAAQTQARKVAAWWRDNRPAARDPKIQFYETIKEIEVRLGDDAVQLESFIVSNTPSHTMRALWSMDKPAMAAKHILFQEEDKDTYIGILLNTVMRSDGPSAP